MNILSLAMSIGQDNPGALQGAIEMLQGNPVYSLHVSLRLKECPSIVGTNFYVLYSDLCNKDVKKMSHLCQSRISNEKLEDACSKQDYSGRKIVELFLADYAEKSESEEQFLSDFKDLL